MALLHISEFSTLPVDKFGTELHIPATPPVASQVVTYTGTAGSSANFNAKTRFVRLCSLTACYYKVGTAGTDPTAVTLVDALLPANVIEVIGVPAGAKISAVS